MGYGGVINNVVDPFGWGDPDPVKTPSTNKVTKDYLGLVSGFQSAAPGIYNTEAQYGPLYTQLGLKDLDLTLHGNQNTPGLLDQYTKSIMPAMTAAQNQATTAQRASTVGDLTKLGPGAMQAWMAANPQAGALGQQLTQSASQGLAAGSALTPEQLRFAQQSARAGQAARGLGWGPSDVFQETLAGTQFGNQLQQQRQNFAAGVSQMNSGNTNAALSMLGGQSATPGAGQAFLGQGAGVQGAAGPKLFNPAQQSDLFSTAYNANAAANIATANNMAASQNSY
jgi:hypothetical protein